jgi:hypothetical protein
MGRKNPKLLAILLGMTLFVCGSCKEDEIIPEAAISVSASGPVATVDHPAVASADQPVEISFSQKSTYKDSNGYMVDCEPHASIKMTVSEKMVHAKNLAELMALTESSKVLDTNSKAPQSHGLEQTFQIGRQTVQFTTTYEVYSYKNAAGKVMELPYVKVNQARLGEAEPSVVEYGGPLEVTPVTAIRIRPITNTRGSILLEDLYEVVVSFNLDVETFDGKSTNKQTYAFEVTYTATVERMFEYPDPASTFDYSFSASGTTTSTKSPYLIRKGENVKLEWKGESAHTWYDTDVMGLRLFSDDCFARTDISATLDTISTYTFSNIEEMIPSAVEDPVVTTENNIVKGSQRFIIGTEKDGQQIITVNWSFENGTSVSTNYGNVAMPYVTISAPEFLGVTMRQLNEDEAPEDVKGYEVTARLRQTFSTVNTDGVDTNQPSTQVVEYEVKHYIMQDIVLRQVGYRKDWEWIERTDTTALAFYPVVYRDRTYSNGEVFTDTFIDGPHVVGLSSTYGPEEYTTYGGVQGTVIYEQAEYDNQGNVFASSIQVGVVAVNNLSAGIVYDGYRTPFPGTWDAYKLQQQFTADMQVPKEGIEIVGDYEPCRKANGWYVFEPDYLRRLLVYYATTNDILDLSLHARFVDAYLVIDDFKFSYLEGRNPMNFNYRVDDTSYGGYMAKRYIHEGSTTFFGKEFKVSATALFYQRAGSRASDPDNSMARPEVKQQPLYKTLPVPYLATPRFIYGGKPKGVKGRY